jgi:putative membrane protein
VRALVTTITAIALLSGCTADRRQDAAAGGSESGMRADTGGTDTASSGTPTGEGGASLSGILSRLELANSAEIQISELGTSRAQSPRVKQIAQTLVASHEKNRQELEALAKEKGVSLLPAAGGNTARDTAGVLALRSLKGAEFDSAFVSAQIEAHQANIDAIRRQMLPAAQDQDVRQYLQKTLAAMEKHLTTLQEIQEQPQR